MSTIYRKNGIFIYAYFEGGRRIRRSLRCRDRKIAELMKAKMDLDLSRQGAGIATDKNIQEYLDWYKATHFSRQKPRNAIKEERILKRFIRENDLERLAQITPDVVNRWLLKQKIGPKTWNNIRGAIKTFLAKAVPKHFEKNPVDAVPFQKVPDHGIDFYTDDEYLAIEKAAELDPMVRDMIVTARYAGPRISEILHLEGKDLSWGERPLLKVENKPHWGHTVKNYQARSIPMSREMVSKLGHLRGKNGLLFPNAKGTPFKNFHETRLNEILKKAEVKRPGRAWHLLRHTFCSRAAQNGIDLFKIGKWAGHKDFKTTLRYAHLAPGYSSEIEKINLRTAPDNAPA